MSTASKILVADDSLTIRKLVERVLCQEGYEVITAETGADCLAQAAQHKPSLILLDYILPDMQGTEVCRSLINSPETWEIPVLMMSSNGNAIRQLYHDLNNVADYLTKPFAPSVLNAVVGHLLQKDSLAQLGETSTSPAVAPVESAPPQDAAVPSEFMDKVNRLINLMESNPAAAPAVKEEEAAAPRAKAPRKRKAVATAPGSDTLRRKFRLALQKYLRARAGQIPEWESARAGEAAEEYYLGRLLGKDALRDLSAELVKITGAPPEATEGLRCPAALAPLDAVLRHLNAGRLTGELRLETGEETILALLDKGEVVFITTNHPRNYCAGAVCDFQAVPHPEIGEAVRAQEEQSIPFFVSLDQAGHLPPGANLDELLRCQGQKCLARAFKAPETNATFHPLKKLPAIAKQYRTEVSVNQLLLACYRMVDDWFTLEKVFPEMNACLAPSPELEDQCKDLVLEAGEAKAMEAIRPGQTVEQLARALNVKAFEVCRILYRFVKLGFVAQESPREAESPVAPPSQEIAAAAIEPAADAAPIVPVMTAPPEPATTPESAPTSAPAAPEPVLTLLETASPAPASPVLIESPAAESAAPIQAPATPALELAANATGEAERAGLVSAAVVPEVAGLGHAPESRDATAFIPDGLATPVVASPETGTTLTGSNAEYVGRAAAAVPFDASEPVSTPEKHT
jgi:DNA-binding response OmpR family regulator